MDTRSIYQTAQGDRLSFHFDDWNSPVNARVFTQSLVCLASFAMQSFFGKPRPMIKFKIWVYLALRYQCYIVSVSNLCWSRASLNNLSSLPLPFKDRAGLIEKENSSEF